MHADCPDYDLCSKCEALPIPVHPIHHPVLKIKNPETAIPIVHRANRSSYQPTYVNNPPIPVARSDIYASSSPSPHSLGVIDLSGGQGGVTSRTPQGHSLGVIDLSERPETPKPTPSPFGSQEDARSPFADPPVIDPIVSVHSLASSFEATINRNRIGLRSPSPPRSPVVAPVNPFDIAVQRQTNEPVPSFVNDLMAQTQFTGLPTPMTQTHSPLPVIGALNVVPVRAKSPVEETKEPSLADLASQNQSLISLAESVSTETKASTILVAPPLPPHHAAFVADVTVTDGQIFPPGAEFVKYWRMINDTSRDWDEGTTCVYVGGTNLLIDPTSDAVRVGKVKAGAEVEVSTGELKAPEEPGRYVSYWRMRDECGNLFGNSIWVEIKVAEPELSDDSLSASSVVLMPTAASVTSRSGSAQPAPSTIGAATTATIPSVTEDTASDIDNDSDVSLIDLVSSDDEEMGWEDARSHTAPSAATNAPTAPVATTNVAPSVVATEDFVVLYDDSSDSDF